MPPSGRIYSKFVPMRIRQALAVGLIAVAPALTGCLTHTRIVPKTRPADLVLNTTLDQLVTQVNTRFDSIKTINASVAIAATTGGGLEGHVVEHPSFSGYIFLRKPEDLRVLLRVPILGSQALDMVSDGKNWKLWIPPRHIAMVGTSAVTKPSKNGLENLRPAVFFDSLVVRGLGADQIVSLTSDTRIVENPNNKKDLIEEPDYDLEILEQPHGQTAHTIRVIHISRADLLPYQQDIYDPEGNIVTRAFYSNYQTFGGIPFPMKVEIKRPLDQYSLTVTMTKVTLNQTLENDQFELKIPDNVPVKTMN
jgi:outer membrane lipoprotein-sorting protein